MRFENIAPYEVASHHLANINEMFNLSGVGENYWESLTNKERELFCTQAGFPRSTAQTPLSKMRPDSRKKLLKTIKEISRAATLFNNVSFSEFG